MGVHHVQGILELLAQACHGVARRPEWVLPCLRPRFLFKPSSG